MPVLILHTTEGSTAASARAAMNANRSWSHWLCDPTPGIDSFETLIDPDPTPDGDPSDDQPARSLRNLRGGVETNNRGGVYQVEIVGFAGKVHTYSDGWFTNLARRVGWVCDTYGVPRVFPFPFTGNDGYGLKGSVRISNAQWLAATGIVGHCHVPENDHWDPGRIDRLIPLVTQGATVPTDPNAAKAARYDQVVEWLTPAHALLVEAGLFQPTTSWDSLAGVLRSLIGDRDAARANATALDQARAAAVSERDFAVRNERALQGIVDEAIALLTAAGHPPVDGRFLGAVEAMGVALGVEQATAQDLEGRLAEAKDQIALLAAELDRAQTGGPGGLTNRQVAWLSAMSLAGAAGQGLDRAETVEAVEGWADEGVAWLDDRR